VLPTDFTQSEQRVSPAVFVKEGIRFVGYWEVCAAIFSPKAKVLHGDPAERISEFTDYSEIDLIILGARELGALRKVPTWKCVSVCCTKKQKSVLLMRQKESQQTNSISP
jgi:Universal stress protein family